MTAIKAKVEDRTVLDFSTGKFSKNKIKQTLNKCEVICAKTADDDHNDWTLFDNHIKIGMYDILLIIPWDCPQTWNRLKQYNDFEIEISESNGKIINLKNDGRFKGQEWVKCNSFGNLKPKHLTDIIAYTIRLNKLSAFI